MKGKKIPSAEAGKRGRKWVVCFDYNTTDWSESECKDSDKRRGLFDPKSALVEKERVIYSIRDFLLKHIHAGNEDNLEGCTV